MDSATFTAAISGAVALVAAGGSAALTYYFSKRREHEADWRKLKLERYGHYVTALSGVVQNKTTPEAQAKYADAINSLALVAPASVLKALYRFQDGIASPSDRHGAATHEELLGSLMNAMRRDVQPGWRRGKDAAPVRFLSAPPGSTPAPEP